MSTITKVWGNTYTSTINELIVNKTDIKYIVVTRIETPDDTTYICTEEMFDEKPSYEQFKDIHNKVIDTIK